MRTLRSLVALTIVNVGLFSVTLAHWAWSAAPEPVAPVVRARALEIVDTQGRVRATLSVLPASISAAGVAQAETVLLRLITERGRPSVKIAASEETSGASFTGPTGTKDSYAILEANALTSSLKLRAEDGREQALAP